MTIGTFERSADCATLFGTRWQLSAVYPLLLSV